MITAVCAPKRCRAALTRRGEMRAQRAGGGVQQVARCKRPAVESPCAGYGRAGRELLPGGGRFRKKRKRGVRHGMGDEVPYRVSRLPVGSSSAKLIDRSSRFDMLQTSPIGVRVCPGGALSP